MTSFRALFLFLGAAMLSAQAPSDKERTIPPASAEAKAGGGKAAIEKLKALLTGNPSPEIAGQARLELARIYRQREDWLDSAEQFRHLRELAPNEAEYAYQLGVAYRNASRWALVKMQATSPGAARVKQLEAEQLAVTGDVGKAIRRYKEAIAAGPGLRGCHLGLAMLYARLGRRAEALAELDEELKIAPEGAVAMRIKRSIEGSR